MGEGEGDRAAFEARIRAMTELLSGIAGHAQAVSKDRCPYMTVGRLCTAGFRCRNQRPVEGHEHPHACGHAGGFDYRLAWESRPETYEVTRERLRRIRAEASARRAAAARAPEGE
jgi:hypothetical protein